MHAFNCYKREKGKKYEAGEPTNLLINHKRTYLSIFNHKRTYLYICKIRSKMAGDEWYIVTHEALNGVAAKGQQCPRHLMPSKHW
jgi:hypothetical protein